MSAIGQDFQSGEMVRRQAIHGTSKQRDAWHTAIETRMERVGADVEIYINTLVAWIVLLDKQAVVSIVGWYAHEHGLSFVEALHRMFSRGDEKWVRTCKEFGSYQSSDVPLRTTLIRPAKATAKQRHQPARGVV
jgi:hypothetical protein